MDKVKVDPRSREFGELALCGFKYCAAHPGYQPETVINYLTGFLHLINDKHINLLYGQYALAKLHKRQFGLPMDAPLYDAFLAALETEREERGLNGR